ncbi:GNAT family N-acetyltransferase [bacterium]|nr:GNAT family N-acetyltransferase [bacterium]
MNGARLEIPIDPSWSSTAQAFVEQASLRYGMHPSQASQLAGASAHLFEILLAQEFQGEHPSLQLSCRVLPGGLEMVVADQGLPFDPQMWTRLEVAGHLQQIQTQVDKLEFANLGLHGKETRLRKYFALAPPTDDPRPENSRERAPLREIRRFQAHDAQAVARCIWRTYGYSYSVLDAVYIPERLTALNQQGLMRSLVAINHDQEVIGHMAYERTSPLALSVTAGVAAVEPAYRSQGVAAAMARQLHQQAIDDGVREVQCYAVTTHPYSQKLALSLGFKSCSLVLGASLFCFEGMSSPNHNQRESLVGYYQALHPDSLHLKQPLYAPNRHRAMLETVCTHLGLDVHFEKPPQVELAPNESVLVLQESPPRKTAKIHVEKYGSHILDRIRSHARYLRLQDYRCFQLTLPLYDPTTVHILKPLEKMGFFFSGLQFRPIGPCLLLQDLYGVTVDYTQMKVEDEMAQELLGYVRYHEPEAV